jgi:hypothetical protein
MFELRDFHYRAIYTRKVARNTTSLRTSCDIKAL